MQYATVAAWNADPRTTDVAPGSSEEKAVIGQLVAASGLVDEMLELSTYRVNPDGTPVSAAVAAALSSACIEQALFTEATDPDGLGVAYGAVSLGSLQLPAGGSGGSSGTDPRSPQAWRVLRAAGLLTGRIAG